MKRILSHPITNAVGISVFTSFYAGVFIFTSNSEKFKSQLYYSSQNLGSPSFWSGWSGFLQSGRHVYIAYALVFITVLVVTLLIIRRKPYDEYHTAILRNCFTAAIMLTLLAIACFYMLVLKDPNGIIEKFTLFITIHWGSVALADLVYILMCR